ncbi:hypothetical protein ACROYT_G014890 [Oculina patagonica]
MMMKRKIPLAMLDKETLRIKIIRKECQNKWQGNTKIYFRSNNNNSLILSELVSSLQASCELPEIEFGQADDMDGKAFCCLKEADFEDLFPLLGPKFRFKNWFQTLTLPQLSLWPEVDSGKEVDLMGVKEFASFVRLTCPSLAQTLAD